jgi:ketosteroid isomerase-like protein
MDRDHARLQAIEDEIGIRDTIHQYCHSLDYGVEDEWMDCFTDTGAWDLRLRDSVIQKAMEAQGLPSGPTRIQGTVNLRKMFSGHTHSPERWHKHAVSNTRIKLNGDEAVATSYFIRVDASTKSSGAYIRAFGRYIDQMVRCPDGKWRIQERRCDLEAHIDESMFGEVRPGL